MIGSCLADGLQPRRLDALAMLALNNQLIDEKAGLLRLLDPPLQHSSNNPGYIQAYPPGVRENGGQYSHAGVWALMAIADFARTNRQAQPQAQRRDRVGVRPFSRGQPRGGEHGAETKKIGAEHKENWLTPA